MQPDNSNELQKDVVKPDGLPFRGVRAVVVIVISLLVVVACLWHRRIEAGDLASHVYNAWLAELVEKGQAPGLYLSKQTTNVLFDLGLFYSAKMIGLAAAQKVVVSSCVLVFFWGVFAFVRAVTGQSPWLLTPCMAMLTYGYSFEMGFLNYYVSIGLACFGLAIFWRGQGREWIGGLLLLPIVWLAHPIGFFWLIGPLAYIKIRAKLRGWWKLVLPLAAASGIFAVYWYTAHRAKFLVDWDRGPFYFYNGADQLALFDGRYFVLAGAAFFFGVFCVVVDAFARGKDRAYWKAFELPFEWYAVAFCATSLLPENLRPSMYAGWIGLLASRLTTISAILGLCILGFLRPRKWHLAGFATCALCFFAFLYQDTAWMNRLEANAEKLTGGLQPGTRVLGTIWSPKGWRVSFVGHVLDRACIGHCFSYANYEASTGEFRVRAQKGSSVVTTSSDDAEDMASGEYEVDGTDLPMKQLYQCDASDLTKLCIRDLQAGEVNGRMGYKPSAH
jgi:hypothetical protein